LPAATLRILLAGGDIPGNAKSARGMHGKQLYQVPRLRIRRL